MPIVVELRRTSGEVIRGLPDPAGGTFDAAGDFDRLLPQAPVLHRVVPDRPYALLDSIDPYGETIFGSENMVGLIADIDEACQYDLTARERRGIERLRVMATRCSESDGLIVVFLGD